MELSQKIAWVCRLSYLCRYVKEREGKEEYLYSAFIQCLVSKRSDMEHTVLPANYTIPAFVSVHQMAPLLNVVISNCSSLLIYPPREDKRPSWPGWLTYSRRLTHINDHPSATGRAQDGERTLARDWRSTAEPRGPTNLGLQYTQNQWIPTYMDKL